MNITNNWISILLIPIITLFATGCRSVNDKEESKSVALYAEQNTRKTNKDTNLKLPKKSLNTGFVRTQGNELNNNFVRLPNPTLNLFIYPHLTQDGHPVPGYTTVFSMYAKDHYALPNEIY